MMKICSLNGFISLAFLFNLICIDAKGSLNGKLLECVYGLILAKINDCCILIIL